jgi:hypothetical protein
MAITPSSVAAATLTWTSASTFQLFNSCTIYLQGESSASKDPYKAMTAWYKANASAIAFNGLIAPLTLSSWAIVVDITWKLSFNNVRTTNPTNDALTPPSAAA